LTVDIGYIIDVGLLGESGDVYSTKFAAQFSCFSFI